LFNGLLIAVYTLFLLKIQAFRVAKGCAGEHHKVKYAFHEINSAIDNLAALLYILNADHAAISVKREL
jgi:hypothetical protein